MQTRVTLGVTAVWRINQCEGTAPTSKEKHSPTAGPEEARRNGVVRGDRHEESRQRTARGEAGGIIDGWPRSDRAADYPGGSKVPPDRAISGLRSGPAIRGHGR